MRHARIVAVILAVAFIGGCVKQAMQDYVDASATWTEAEFEANKDMLYAAQADICVRKTIDNGVLDALSEIGFTKDALRSVCQCSMRWIAAEHPWWISGAEAGVTSDLTNAGLSGTDPPGNPEGCEGITPWIMIVADAVRQDDFYGILAVDSRRYMTDVTAFDDPGENRARWDAFVESEWLSTYRQECTRQATANGYPKNPITTKHYCGCLAEFMYSRIPGDWQRNALEEWANGNPPASVPNRCRSAIHVAGWLDD